MASEFTPHKAQKQSVKLKMAIQGPSGSGKTEGALALAKNLVPNAKILLIDTENESASLYADRYEFDTIPLKAPYTSARYAEAMRQAVNGGYDVLVVDSISQQWDGEGGILRRKEDKDRAGGNSFTNWASFTPEHTKFIEFIKQLPVHTIVTMRSKQAYILETNDKGKQTPRKVGLDPIQREGTEYEYTIVFEVNMAHRAATSKNRTTLFSDGELIDLKSAKVAQDIKEWLANGVLLPRPTEDVAGTVSDEVERQKAAYTPDPAAQKATIVEMHLPPELDWSYVKSSGLLICRIVDAKLSKKKKGEGELVTLKLNNTINGKNIVFYFHSTHRYLLLASVGKTAKLVVAESGDFLHVSEVLEVDGQKIEAAPSEQAETQARLLASTLEFTEEELRELFSRYCNSSWVETLAKLQAEKVRREEMVPA